MLGPLWWRQYALEEDEQQICDQADEVRKLLGVRRLIMGELSDGAKNFTVETEPTFRQATHPTSAASGQDAKARSY